MGLDHGFIYKRKDGTTKEYTFRKANQIHDYIINNYHNGIDNQKNFRIPRAGIESLQKILIQVIDSLEQSPKEINKDGNEVYTDTTIAKELLPTQSGFFFGGLEYDDWYLNQCKNALLMCNEILIDQPIGIITYWCWW